MYLFPTFRRSHSIILSLDDQGLLAFDFVRRRSTYLDQIGLALLSFTTAWVDLQVVLNWLQPYHCPCCILNELSRLTDLELILVQGTEAANADDLYTTQWVWGAMAGYFHFGIKDPYYMNPEETTNYLFTQAATTPLVPLYTTNDAVAEVVPLPPPRFDTELFSVMRARRSYRGFDSGKDKPVTLEQLRDCLFSGVGITGFVETPMAELGLLPLKMAPSAGARNPYEAYVYACNVAGLKKGVYHYSALDNSLGLIRDHDLPTVGNIVAVQPWFDNAAALILLVANFDRTMWKYTHPTGFRVVLIEAGHIAQNILLAATAGGLASAPTSAISDSLAQDLLGLNTITQSVIYTVAIGVGSKTPTQADVACLIPNPYLEGSNKCAEPSKDDARGI